MNILLCPIQHADPNRSGIEIKGARWILSPIDLPHQLVQSNWIKVRISAFTVSKKFTVHTYGYGP